LAKSIHQHVSGGVGGCEKGAWNASFDTEAALTQELQKLEMIVPGKMDELVFNMG
jgi:pseudouridine-5'-phosphate glycosidase